eukprot:GEMP01007070.1.p1 GENE.GEMP01007070.1~~GEMP01007070.1.p1  ORF type:complete len:555 (+),score=118.31 GEMP01007070.1:25-1665(+)
MSDDTAYEFEVFDYPWDVSGSESARIWCRRGLVWFYGYHMEEALYCFRRATEVDPNCAMGYWGMTLSHLPNYNFSTCRAYYDLAKGEKGYPCMKEAFESINTAKTLRTSVTKKEADLIDVLALMVSYPVNDFSHHCLNSYVSGMRELRAKYPNDIDILSLLVAAILQTRPWRMFSGGKAAPEVPEIIALIERGTTMNPEHIGILHFYIHFNEMNPNFSRWGADALDKLGPRLKDLAHLHHMPSHLFVQVGDYAKCIDGNQRAIVANQKILKNPHDSWLYRAYTAHDSEFYVWCCMFAGRKRDAEIVARDMKEKIVPESFLLLNELVKNGTEFYHSLEFIIMLRFGEWEKILTQAIPKDKELYSGTVAMLYFTRGVAFGVLGRTIEGREEEKKLKAHVATSKSLHDRYKHICTLHEILAVAMPFLDGELSYREKNFDHAFAKLEEAVRLEDDLPYDEPWGWLVPTRHALAALLHEEKHFAKAEEVYLADLKRHPNNVWSLVGLRDCYQDAGKEITEDLDKQVGAAQQLADEQIKASCACALSKFRTH